MAQVKKQTLMTGLGDGYFQEMTTEETASKAPVYAEEVEIVPSLQSAETEMTYESSPIFLSNKKHSDLGKVSDLTINLSAGYLPEGFAERMTGAIKLGEGVYGYNSNPIQKFFRFAFPMTDENGGEVIVNMPKCQLQPVGLNPQTETDTKEAQITSYSIVGNALIYRPAIADAADDLNNTLYVKADLRSATTAKLYDRDALLEKGWFDKATLAECLVSVSDPEV